MATVNLAAKPREGAGKGVARKLRMQEQVPAIVYGYGTDPFQCSVDAAGLRKALSTGSGSRAVIKLDVEGVKEPRVTIIKEIQRHPVSRKIIHIDLLQIDLTQPVEVSVPISPQGTAIGVRLEGGVMSWARRELEIRVLPTAIPESIELDLTDLHVNQAVHVGDITAEDFEILTDEKLTICSVASTSLELGDEDGEEEESVEVEGETEDEDSEESSED